MTSNAIKQLKRTANEKIEVERTYKEGLGTGAIFGERTEGRWKFTTADDRFLFETNDEGAIAFEKFIREHTFEKVTIYHH